MTGLPSYGEDVEKLIVAMGWPVSWLDRYREGNYFYKDPVSMEAMRSARKYSWGEARDRHPATRVSLQIEDEAKDMGLADGLAFPLFDPDNWQAIVSLSSEQRLDLPDRMQNMVYLAAAVAQGRATALLEPNRPRVARLTARECDVLSWLAHGKTKGEVADILMVSENTIKMHVRHIIEKLNVSNVTHAVARAVHSRQIQL
jgi:DNA-binding CsgD family transcriptional regulator